MVKISVQISTFNRSKVLQEVLKSLDNQTLDRDLYEVIVINDGSTDNTKQIVENISKIVSYRLILVNQENLGLPIARNKGIINTDHEVILFIDDDVLADKNLLLEHYKIHTKFDDVVVRGWVNHIDQLKIPDKPRFRIADFSTSFFWTSNVSIRKKYLIQAGMFYEKFEKYGWEDIEMGYRLRKLGLRLIINNKAIGYHYKPIPNLSAENIEKVLEIEKKRALSARIYYDLYKSLRVRLAIGYYFPAKNFYYLLANSPLYDKLYEYLKRTNTPALRFLLFSLLKKMYYYKSLLSG
ncbi:MAG: glycosyltransferase [Candidatus Calescibacterium sp.]|nr:glycosyltransferase [Candidatus Calescibacterium sp.]MCX7972079.1 glycosyltransferase [bacterium]MDW8194636.1 glycosyltransferase [Candidatus Calescibacterium sp.]